MTNSSQSERGGAWFFLLGVGYAVVLLSISSALWFLTWNFLDWLVAK